MKRIHPLGTGSLYGLIAGVIWTVLAFVNQPKYLNGNGYISFINNVILPLVIVYLAGHFTGRNERIRLGTTITSGAQSTLFGTAAGLSAGVVFVIVKSLLGYGVEKIQGSTSLLGSTLGALSAVALIVIWFVMGLAFGTIGGFFGDSRAHKQLKSGTLQPAVAKK